MDPNDETLRVLASHRPGLRPYSATAMQHFAACPYRFALSAIHRLEPREDLAALEKMDPLTRGSLFHAIQFKLLSTLRSQDLLPITHSNHPRVAEIADNVVDSVAEVYREDLAPAIARIWEGEVEDIRWDMRGWIREMVQPENAAAWKPQWFELSFGMPFNAEHDPASRVETVSMESGLQLRGSIDMIEERNGRLRVTDHKTGKTPIVPPGLTGRGEVLQPVLYASAAEVMLGQPVEVARLFYCTERGGYRSIEVPVNPDSKAALQQIVRTIDSFVSSGFLPAAPREGACTWCDYRIVCGPYEEMRIRRKPKDRLAELDKIRKGP